MAFFYGIFLWHDTAGNRCQQAERLLETMVSGEPHPPDVRRQVRGSHLRPALVRE